MYAKTSKKIITVFALSYELLADHLLSEIWSTAGVSNSKIVQYKTASGVSQEGRDIYTWWIRTLLRRCLKTDSNNEDVMSSGRSFHMLALETGKACLLAEVIWKDGTVRPESEVVKTAVCQNR